MTETRETLKIRSQEEYLNYINPEEVVERVGSKRITKVIETVYGKRVLTHWIEEEGEDLYCVDIDFIDLIDGELLCTKVIVSRSTVNLTETLFLGVYEDGVFTRLIQFDDVKEMKREKECKLGSAPAYLKYNTLRELVETQGIREAVEYIFNDIMNARTLNCVESHEAYR